MVTKQANKVNRNRTKMDRTLFLRIDAEIPGVAARRAQETPGSVVNQVGMCNRRPADATDETEPCGKPIAFVLDAGALGYAIENNIEVPEDFKGYTSPCDVSREVLPSPSGPVAVTTLAFTWRPEYKQYLPSHDCRYPTR